MTVYGTILPTAHADCPLKTLSLILYVRANLNDFRLTGNWYWRHAVPGTNRIVAFHILQACFQI